MNKKKKIKKDIKLYFYKKGHKDVGIETLKDSAVIDLLHEILYHSEFTYNHSLNVAFYSFEIGLSLSLSKKDLIILVKAALLHDVGKLFIPLSILNKESILNQEEFKIIKTHSSLGACYLLAKGFSLEIANVAYRHHKKIDETGYPEWLTEELNIFTKIVAVVDVYDAITADRPYHVKKNKKEDALLILKEENHKYDSNIIDRLMTIA